jgi:hypothetical protein
VIPRRSRRIRPALADALTSSQIGINTRRVTHVHYCEHVRSCVARCHSTLAAISTFGVPDALTRIAAAAVMLAKLGLELSGHRPRIPVDLDAVTPRLRAAWIRVLLVSEDDPTRLEEIDDASLLHALGNASIDTARAPALVFDRLGRAADPWLRAMVLERRRAAADRTRVIRPCTRSLVATRGTVPYSMHTAPGDSSAVGASGLATQPKVESALGP